MPSITANWREHSKPSLLAFHGVRNFWPTKTPNLDCALQQMTQGDDVAKPMKRIDIVKRGDRWVAERKGGGRVYVEGSTKAKAVSNAARKAQRDPRGVTIRIHGKDGKIQEERTYPRAADRGSSKG